MREVAIMTAITVHMRGEHILGFTAKGHSGYAEKGEDIVCAAVSALTETAYLGLTELLKLEPEFRSGDGELRVMLPKELPREQGEKAELILGSMLLGLRAIEENYSNYLKISKREVKA